MEQEEFVRVLEMTRFRVEKEKLQAIARIQENQEQAYWTGYISGLSEAIATLENGKDKDPYDFAGWLHPVKELQENCYQEKLKEQFPEEYESYIKGYKEGCGEAVNYLREAGSVYSLGSKLNGL